MKNIAYTLCIGFVSITTGHAAAQTTVVDFDTGAQGWIGSNGSVLTSDGNGNQFMRTIDETFGVQYWNNTNQSFLGDYSPYESVTLSVDVQIDKIDTSNLPEGFTRIPLTRSLVLELRNNTYADGFFDYASVFFVIETNLSSANYPDFTTLGVTFDPNSTELPAGWGGFGGSDDANGPVLPAGATFADIVANVDEVVFTTRVPTEFYLLNFFEFSVDNFSITTTTQSQCPADINDDGSLNFFDVSAFLNAFAAADPLADFTGDGQFNFFDVSAFLNAFSAGCP
ncbi:hypothetical protein COB72_05760 [bacterium]|nr:MAG: hypothetical protein COB72_05760 [bacterium]